MKLKRLPEDFRVEEQIALEPSGGPFALYRLTKQSLGTPEALDAVVKRWNLRRPDVAFAGLKDKHALTAQFITIRQGPRRGLSQANIELEYLGQTPRHIHASDIGANRFQVVVRDLSAVELERVRESLVAIDRDGLPNYFDNQRFGSLGVSGEFIAKPWCLGDYERTLWLAMAEENVHDAPHERNKKRLLREHWNDWSACQSLVRGWRYSDIIDHLMRCPHDFRRAIALVRQDLRSLWLAAFQSHLWNQILARLLSQVCQPDGITGFSVGQRELPFYMRLSDPEREQLESELLPLPSARLHLEPGPLKELYDQTLSAEGLELRQVRVKYPRDSFFSKGQRTAIFRASQLQASDAADELYPGNRKVTLAFTLPRGSYATILIKRLVGVTDTEADDSIDE